MQAIKFEDVPGWGTDDHLAALQTFARQRLKPNSETYRQGRIGVKPSSLDALVVQAESALAQAAPQRFFEQNFRAVNIGNVEGKDRTGRLTAFYEPEVEALSYRGGNFQTPILRRPADLVALNDNNRPAKVDPSCRFGRQQPDGTVGPYYDRAQINAGALDSDQLALAYLADPIEAFFIHIQGAARLHLEDDSLLRVTYDGKSGHPFTAIGRLLVDRGEIAAQDISMQTIKAWLRAHPDKAMPLMEENRSYIFFKKAPTTDKTLGPVAAAKVPLTAGRSLAVDRSLHTFGTPIFVNADSVNGAPFARLMIAQETGTAIVGPTRGDLFCGTGLAAGQLAGAVNSPCDFTLLIPAGADFDIGKIGAL